MRNSNLNDTPDGGRGSRAGSPGEHELDYIMKEPSPNLRAKRLRDLAKTHPTPRVLLHLAHAELDAREFDCAAKTIARLLGALFFVSGMPRQRSACDPGHGEVLQLVSRLTRSNASRDEIEALQ